MIKAGDFQRATRHAQKHLGRINGTKPLLATRTYDGYVASTDIQKLTDALRGLQLLKLPRIPSAAALNAKVLRLETKLDDTKCQLDVVTAQIEARREADQPPDAKLKARSAQLLKTIAATENKITKADNDDTETVSFAEVLESMLLEYDYVGFWPKRHISPLNPKATTSTDEVTRLNMFRGYAVESLLPDYPDRNPELTKDIHWHIRNVLCAGNEEFYQFTLKFIAHMLQYPDRKCGVCLVFVSEEGVGKGQFEGLMCT
jgi:hypothetical protein